MKEFSITLNYIKEKLIQLLSDTEKLQLQKEFNLSLENFLKRIDENSDNIAKMLDGTELTWNNIASGEERIWIIIGTIHYVNEVDLFDIQCRQQLNENKISSEIGNRIFSLYWVLRNVKHQPYLFPIPLHLMPTKN